MPEYWKIGHAQKNNDASKPNQPMNITLLKSSHSEDVIRTKDIIRKTGKASQALTHADVMQLQKSIGNQAVCQFMQKMELMDSKPAVPVNKSSRTVAQYALMNAHTFDTPREIEDAGETGNYLKIYLQIRESVYSYNEELKGKTLDVIRQLKLLDLISGKVALCRSSITKEGITVTRSVMRRLIHLADLITSLEQEKAALLDTKTEQKEILAGPQAVLRSGVPWQFWHDKKKEWIDASTILSEGQTLPVTIIAREGGQSIFSFLIDTNQERGKILHRDLQLGTKFTMDHSPLYPHGIPTKEDVQQTNLGDCYLQAALAGLAAQNPSYIADRMIHEAGDRVIVRLYKLPEREPHFINVERSKAQTIDGTDLYNNGALWVKMIQKAYAASGLASTAFDRKNVSIEDISKDMVGYLMGVLTGQALTTFEVDGGTLQEEYQKGTPLDFDVITLNYYLKRNEVPSKFREPKDYSEYYSALGRLKQLFGTNMDQIRIWAEFAYTNSSELEKLQELEAFAELFTQKNLDPGIKEVIQKWLEDSKLYRGRIGSGKYSIGQILLLKRIQDAISMGKLVAIGSKKKLTLGLGDGTGFAGESKYKGLAGGHAYTVLNARSNLTSNPESPVAGPYCWVQLRNPWGHYSRTYDIQWNPVAVDAGNGVFWVELTDLTNNFTEVEII